MTGIGPVLARLGIDQYLDALVGEGFDTWETLLDITESDLDALNVKLGHRRKLQREIANYRGVAYETSLDSPAREAQSDSSKADTDATLNSASGEKKGAGGTEGKRKYQRHPKPDENAPDRPPSAYVIFSSKIREDVKSRNFSFTEIAKLVGENWQMLTPAQKEPFEAQAAAAKERYNTELTQYKRTESYRKHMQYLTDFKSKRGSLTTEGKRPKLEKESSSLSSGVSIASSVKAESSDSLTPMPRHNRGTSVGSGSYPSNLSSPSSTVPSFFSQAPDAPTIIPGHRNSPGTDSSSQSVLPRSSVFSVTVASRPPPAGGNDPDRETKNLQIPQGALTAEGYQGYAPISASEQMAQPPRPAMLPPTFLRQETSTSHSSMSSGLSPGSTSSVPGIYTPGSTPSAPGFPHTPSDDVWARRSNVTLGVLPPPDSYKGDHLRPFHAPAAGPYYQPLPTPQLANRGNQSSSTAESQRIDTYLRSLPPPTLGAPPSGVSQYESSRRRSLRSHVSDPGGARLPTTSQADEAPSSLPTAQFTDPDDPLAVLAYAGNIVDNERRDASS